MHFDILKLPHSTEFHFNQLFKDAKKCFCVGIMGANEKENAFQELELSLKNMGC